MADVRENIEQRLTSELEQYAKVLAGKEGIGVLFIQLGYSVGNWGGMVYVQVTPLVTDAPEVARIIAEDRWYSTDGKNWQNDARPGETIDSDPNANLTGQVILDEQGNVRAQARSLTVEEPPQVKRKGKAAAEPSDNDPVG